jgi:hypothetical protein
VQIPAVTESVLRAFPHPEAANVPVYSFLWKFAGFSIHVQVSSPSQASFVLSVRQTKALASSSSYTGSLLENLPFSMGHLDTVLTQC